MRKMFDHFRVKFDTTHIGDQIVSMDRDPHQRLWLSLGYGGKTASIATWRYWKKATSHDYGRRTPRSPTPARIIAGPLGGAFLAEN
jgi:hypothetical protein